MRKINMIVIHCADTYANMDIGAGEIRQWHVKDNGWSDIGYHDVIRRDGTNEKGRPLGVAGSHAKGYNSNSIGICLVGGKGIDNAAEFNFTQAQMRKLAALVAIYRDMFPGIEVVGHRDLTSTKKCPAFDAKLYFQEVKDVATPAGPG